MSADFDKAGFSRRCGLFGLKEFVLAGFLTAGYFKADPRLAWLPVDFTVFMAGFLAILIGWFLLKNRFYLPRNIFPPIVLFLLFLPGLFVAEWDDYSIEKVARFFTLTLLAAIGPVFLIKDWNDLGRFWNALSFLGLILAVDALLRVPQSDELSRLTGFGSNTIALGRAAGVALIWLVILGLEGRLHFMGFFPVAGIAAFALLGAGSRGPLLAAGLALFIYFVFLKSNFYQLMRFMGLVAGVILVLAMSITWVPESSLERVARLLTGTLGSSEEVRLQAYLASWELMQNNPLGLGLGGFASAVELWSGEVRVLYPHNIVLETFLEGGWLAGLYFLGLVGISLFRGYRLGSTLRKAEPRALLSVFVYMFLNALVSGDLNDNRLFFATLSLTLTLGKVRTHSPFRGGSVNVG